MPRAAIESALHIPQRLPAAVPPRLPILGDQLPLAGPRALREDVELQVQVTLQSWLSQRSRRAELLMDVVAEPFSGKLIQHAPKGLRRVEERVIFDE